MPSRGRSNGRTLRSYAPAALATRDTSFSSPRGYCESQNSNGEPLTYDFYWFTISSATHTYTWVYDTADHYWDCSVDNSAKRSRSQSALGMTYGQNIDVQGEAHRRGAQIGRMYPDTPLMFSSLQYRKYGTSTWYGFTPTRARVDSPYGWTTTTGKAFVWTNAN